MIKRFNPKVGDQFLMTPLLGVTHTAVYLGFLDGRHEFTTYVQGQSIGSLTQTPEDLKENAFGLKRIDKDHPNYIQEPNANMMIELMGALSDVEKAGKGDDPEAVIKALENLAKKRGI